MNWKPNDVQCVGPAGVVFELTDDGKRLAHEAGVDEATIRGVLRGEG